MAGGNPFECVHFYRIFKGLILSVKRFLQNTANYVRVSLATIFLFHFVALIGLIAAPDEAVAERDKVKKAVEPITRKLPIWGEKIREMGYDLPLPFGVGANFVYMD